ncbi:MAG: SPOR domain-containing protein [Pseudomonadota bacterium]|nr:SPOR domain-containing protein [Pseudomonadota bacterium]
MFGKAPKRGAVKRPPQSEQPLVPNWLWLLFGTLVGLSVAVLLFLWQPWRPAERPTAADIANLPEPVAEVEDKSAYEFYDLLPQQQVTPVPDQEVPIPSTAGAEPLPSPLPITPAPEDTDSVIAAQNQVTPDPFEANPIEQAAVYLLQVNSFTNPDEADRQRAEVLLVGLSADVRQSVDPEGTRWYRVVSGPYLTRDEAINAQRLLQNSGIAALVVEQR